jgi:hypothetical protein
MTLTGLFSHRVRGFRALDLAALLLFLALALTVYAFKTSAGAQRTDIADIETQIRDEDRDVRLLRAKVAGLESADHLEPLAKGVGGMAPINAKQEIPAEALGEVAQSGALRAPASNAAANTVQADAQPAAPVASNQLEAAR